MAKAPDELAAAAFLPEPANLRFLRRLVTTLAVVMIVAVITIAALLVIRLTQTPPSPEFPAGIVTPAGERLRAATLGEGWTAIVTIDAAGTERIHILRPDGTIRQSVEIAAE